MLRRINRSLKHTTALILCLLTFSNSTHINANEDKEQQLLDQINQLETEFKAFSADFYKTSFKQPREEHEKSINIERLLIRTNRLVETHQPIAAIQLLYTHKKAIKENLDHKSIFTFTELLLNNNEWYLANELLSAIHEEADRSLTANTQFIFAKYHAPRNEWIQVNRLLQGVFTELSPEDAAYAYLLNGSALQRLKKHREAVNNYVKIAVDSQFYTYAQLNTAIANIRQGWWTDALTTIQDIIKLANMSNEDELTNRLYLVLGYSLLQKEYYRDARDSFRHIGLNSQYTNRALLGIGLTATNQGDYIGGLNALTLLENKKTSDLSVDESYLVLPYIYEKLQQQLTATTSYTQAMKYYKKRINNITRLTHQSIKLADISYTEHTTNIIIKNNSLDYGKHFPKSFLNNHQRLINFLAHSKSDSLDKKINTLIKKHNTLLQSIVNHLMIERTEYLKSYLNQSRYGLARIYDKSNNAGKNTSQDESENSKKNTERKN